MNDNQIESLLRKAPRPPAPAKLKQQLLVDIDLPRITPAAVAGTPLWRRWLPAFSFGLLLLGCLIVLGMQTSQLLSLRREHESLRAATANLEQLRLENAELQRLRAASQEAERRRKENEELIALRSEVAELRIRAQELPDLRAENQRLQTERASAAAKAGLVAEEDPFSEAKKRAERINCISNIKQIGLAARMWAHDHKELLPSDFLTMSNELNTPKILTCPADTTRSRAVSWQEFNGSSVSYELLSPGADEREPWVVYVRCPIHNNVGLTDGSAQMLMPTWRVEKVDGKFKIIYPTQPARP